MSKTTQTAPDAKTLQSQLAGAAKAIKANGAAKPEPEAATTPDAVRQRVAKQRKRQLPADVWARINPFASLAKGPGFRQTARKVAKAIARAVSFDAKFAKGKPTQATLKIDLSARAIQNGLTPVVRDEQVVGYDLTLAMQTGGQVVEGYLRTPGGETPIYEMELKYVGIRVKPAETGASDDRKPIISPQFLAELLCDPDANLQREVADSIGLDIR